MDKKASDSCFALAVNTLGVFPTQKSHWPVEPELPGVVGECTGTKPWPGDLSWGHLSSGGAVGKAEFHTTGVRACTYPHWSGLTDLCPAIKFQISVGPQPYIHNGFNYFGVKQITLQQYLLKPISRYNNTAMHFTQIESILNSTHWPGKAELSEWVQREMENAEAMNSGSPFPSCRGRQGTLNPANPSPLEDYSGIEKVGLQTHRSKTGKRSNAFLLTASESEELWKCY